jgi:hypothetical protein
MVCFGQTEFAGLIDRSDSLRLRTTIYVHH